MSYNPATDFIGLWRAVSGGVAKLEMPGLDFVISAFGRSGLINVSVSSTQPISNQATTAWFQPASPSYSGEGGLQLWNGSAYVAATPRLFLEMLAAAEKAAASAVAVSSLLDTLSATQGAVIFRGSAGWQALGPGISGYVFTTQGAAANPIWSSPSAAGVSSVGGQTGAIGVAGNITMSGSNIILQSSPTIGGHPTIEGVTSTGATGIGKFVFDTAPTISGHPTIEGVTSTGATGTGNLVFSIAPHITGHPTIEGVTSTGSTGSGNFVFDTGPVLTGALVNGGSYHSSVGANSMSPNAPVASATNVLFYVVNTTTNFGGIGTAVDGSVVVTSAADYYWAPNNSPNIMHLVGSSGNLFITGTYSPSDARLKTEVGVLGDVSKFIDDLRPVSFKWKDPKRPQGVRYGFIAQEVQALLPQLVERSKFISEDAPDGALSLNLDELFPILLAEIKALRGRVATLETK